MQTPRTRMLLGAAPYVVGLILLIGLLTTYSRWWPALTGWVDRTLGIAENSTVEDPHAHDDHHNDHAAGEFLELSPQARRNLGLTDEYLRPVVPSTYRRTITVPAVVVGRPGRTQIQVATPLTGVVTHVHAVTGEVVRPGELLFEVRLTHEDLVTTQTEFLRSLGELDVENREIARLEKIAQTGAISGKSLLERGYAKEKLEALLKARREALKLHGLSDRQIDEIVDRRRLLRDLRIVAPDIDSHEHENELQLSERPVKNVSFSEHVGDGDTERQGDGRLLIVDHLDVHKGQAVTAGADLCTLADFGRLYIEGQAFEQDGPEIARAISNGWKVTALFPHGDGEQAVYDLKPVFLGNSVDREMRTLSFYVDLPNEIVRDAKNEDGRRFVSWRYRPGQRLQLLVPVEEWTGQIVLPIEALVREGAEWFVFRGNGNRFDRVPVHVHHRDRRSAVVANDGSVYPGDVLAMRAAHQMQMAIKNKSGGGVDPHAGHSH